MGVSFAMKKRSWKELIIERSQRILLPLVFGMAVIVPIHILIWQHYYNQDLSYSFGRGHLWFLANIFIYVLLLLPLFFYLKRNINGIIHSRLIQLLGHPLSALLVALPFVLETLIVKPESFELYAMTWHGFYLGLLAFGFGFLMVFAGEQFWQTVLKYRWFYFAIAISFYLVRLIVYQLNGPKYLIPFEMIAWIYVVFGFGYKYLNQPGVVLSYLSRAAYPVYILHMIFLYLGAALILPLQIPGIFTYVLVTLFSFAGSFISYELIIRRVWWIGICFGLKRIRSKKLVSEKDSHSPQYSQIITTSSKG